MTRDEVEAVAKRYEQRALSAQRQIDMPANPKEDRDRFTGRRDALHLAARMLREALAKSEAPPELEPGTKTMLLPAVPAFEMTFSGVAMSTGIEIAAFGPGLWIVETVERSESDPKMAHVTAYPVSP